MASAIIHICVAKKMNEKLKRNEKMLFLGAIAPDLSKHVGKTKLESHFLTTGVRDVPNIEAFVNKYHDCLNNDFELGYLIHLYTDKLWFQGFIDNFVIGDSIKLFDGTSLNINISEVSHLIYNDYTNMNIQLLDEYDLDLSLFYEDLEYPNSKIEEIPIEQLNLLVDKMGIIVANSQEEKTYIFDIHQIKNFIEEASDKIYKRLIERGIVTK